MNNLRLVWSSGEDTHLGNEIGWLPGPQRGSCNNLHIRTPLPSVGRDHFEVSDIIQGVIQLRTFLTIRAFLIFLGRILNESCRGRFLCEHRL